METRLAQAHARVKRALHNMRIRDNRNASVELLPEEIKDAKEEIVRLAQCEAFRDEYALGAQGNRCQRKAS